MKKGLTLIELLVVIVLLGGLSAAVVFVFMAGLKSWNSVRNRTEIIESLNLAMARMTRELSQASEITRARSDEIDFEADLDGGGVTEDITFDINSDDELERIEDGGSAVILARDVQSFTLGYYLEADNDNLLSSVTGPSLDDIRVIVITLALSKSGETVSLRSSAYARNQGLDDG